MAQKSIELTVDERLVQEAGGIYEKLGFSLNDAIRVFLSQSVISRGLPFAPRLPDSPAPKEEPKAEREPSIPEEIARRVEANEELVRRMRLESAQGEGARPSPEQNPTSEAASEPRLEADESQNPVPPDLAPEPKKETPAAAENPEPSATSSSAPLPETPSAEGAPLKGASIVDDEEESAETPSHLFDSWNVGTEEDIGCGT